MTGNVFHDNHKTETYKSLITISVDLFKILVLINGGAAAGMIASLDKVSRFMSLSIIRSSLLCFGLGLTFATLAIIGSWFTQKTLHEENINARPDRAHERPLSCTACPKRTGNHPELFADIASADVCTDPVCFGEKRDAHKAKLKAIAEQSGRKVIAGAEAKKIRPNSYSNDLNGGYVNLDSTCYADKKFRTYRQILGKAAPEPALLEDPHSDKLLDVVKADDIKPLLAEKGIAKSDRERASAEQKKADAKLKQEREFRRRLFDAVRATAPRVPDLDDLRAIAQQLFLQSDQRPLIIELYGWDKSVDDYSKRQTALPAAIAALGPDQVTLLILDLLLAKDLGVSSYHLDSSKPEYLLAAAARAGVDPAPLRAALKAEAKARDEAKAKKATKKAAPASKLEPKEKTSRVRQAPITPQKHRPSSC